MRNYCQLLMLFVLLIGAGCNSNNTDKAVFTISNKSNRSIDSLYVDVSESSTPYQVVSIQPNERISYKLDMSEHNGDGSYIIGYWFKGDLKWIKKGFGYFTNGSQIENNINITIMDTTIIVD